MNPFLAIFLINLKFLQNDEDTSYVPPLSPAPATKLFHLSPAEPFTPYAILPGPRSRKFLDNEWGHSIVPYRTYSWQLKSFVTLYTVLEKKTRSGYPSTWRQNLLSEIKLEFLNFLTLSNRLVPEKVIFIFLPGLDIDRIARSDPERNIFEIRMLRAKVDRKKSRPRQNALNGNQPLQRCTLLNIFLIKKRVNSVQRDVQELEDVHRSGQ